jgi:hypothetical protein
VAALNFVGWEETIGCGGVTVVPGDIIVADQDGAVVIPAALLEAATAAAVEQERLEAWIMQEVGKGLPLPGLYPPNAETKARYEADRDVGAVRAAPRRAHHPPIFSTTRGARPAVRPPAGAEGLDARRITRCSDHAVAMSIATRARSPPRIHRAAQPARQFHRARATSTGASPHAEVPSGRQVRPRRPADGQQLCDPRAGRSPRWAERGRLARQAASSRRAPPAARGAIGAQRGRFP